MKKNIISIGIDVAKATLSICLHYSDDSEKVLTIRNTNSDIKKRLLPKMQDFNGRIVMESTGHYHGTPAIILAEKDFNVYVVNPLLAKQYVSGNIRKIKSDPADASSLARMARVADNLPQPFTKDRKSLGLRKKLGFIASLSKQIQALNANINTLEEGRNIIEEENSLVIEEIAKTIAILQKQMKALEIECIKEMQKDEEKKRQMELITTIPGVSDFMALLCMHGFNFENGETAKSGTAYSGFDVSTKESGTGKGICRITRRGNAFLRKRLYSSAGGAWQNDENFKKMYLSLRESGRAHNEALVIIARKIIRLIYTVLKTQTPYDATKCGANV